MLCIYAKREEHLEEIHALEDNAWINLTNPSKDELETIAAAFSAPMDFFTDPLDNDERSRLEIDEDVLLLIVRTPYFEPTNTKNHFYTVPLGIIICPKAVITICSRSNEVIQEFVRQEVKGFDLINRKKFILQILLRNSLLFLKYLKDINRRTAEVEYELQESLRNEGLVKLMNIEKALVFFTTSLRTNEITMERMHAVNSLGLDDNDRDFLDDTLIENKQAIGMANIYSDIINGLVESFASMINNNLNITMRMLTAITLIISIPTLFASIYGMNVRLPFQDAHFAFLVPIGTSFFLALVAFIIFWRRKLFK